MTQKQIQGRKEFQQALNRAKKENVKVYPSTDNATGMTFYLVQSNNRYYRISVNSDNKLICNCTAGLNNVYCKHRAAVSDLMIQQKSLENKSEPILARDDNGPRIYR